MVKSVIVEKCKSPLQSEKDVDVEVPADGLSEAVQMGIGCVDHSESWRNAVTGDAKGLLLEGPAEVAGEGGVGLDGL